MKRSKLMVIVLVVVLGMTTTLRAEDTIELNKPFKGAIKGPPIQTFGFNRALYVAKVKIKLKAEQDITITAAAKGDGRRVSVRLLDPSGTEVSGGGITKKRIIPLSSRNPDRLEIKEVSVTGEYTITIYSDRIGVFELLAKSSTAPELDEKTIDEKIKRLEKELEELRKLKAKLRRAGSRE